MGIFECHLHDHHITNCLLIKAVSFLGVDIPYTTEDALTVGRLRDN